MLKKRLLLVVSWCIVLCLCACDGMFEQQESLPPDESLPSGIYSEPTEETEEEEYSFEESEHSASQEDVSGDESSEETVGDEIISGDYGYILVEDVAHLSAYYGSETAIELPDELDGHTLTVITKTAFSGNDKIEELKTGNGVVNVSEGAFDGCSALKTVELGGNVASMESSSFDKCPVLEKIEVSSANMYFSSVDGVLFNRDKSVLIRCPMAYSAEEYAVPSHTKTVGAYAFKKCSGIEKIEIGGCSLSEGSFFHCDNLNEISFTTAVKEIPDYCFFGSVMLTELVLEDGTESLGEYAFFGCVALEKLTLPESVSYIADTAFDYCDALSDVQTKGDYAKQWYEEFKK